MSLRSRLAALEASTPKEIILHLADGTTVHHPGPSMSFVADTFDQIIQGRGPLLNAVRDTVEAEGCGLLHQLLKAIADSPIEEEGKPKRKPKSRRKKR